MLQGVWVSFRMRNVASLTLGSSGMCAHGSEATGKVVRAEGGLSRRWAVEEVLGHGGG